MTATISNNDDGDGDGGDDDVNNGGGSGNTTTAATMTVIAAMTTAAAAAAAVAVAAAEAAAVLVAAAAAAAAAVANNRTARRKEEVRGGEFFIPTLPWYITRVFFGTLVRILARTNLAVTSLDISCLLSPSFYGSFNWPSTPQFGQPIKFAPAGRAPRAQWKKKDK